MGKLSGNWITGAHSGRACKHEDIYTKVNRVTGACYSVKLCNPNTDWNADQMDSRTAFSAISSAISQWVEENKESNSTDYKKLMKSLKAQKKYSTLRGMMLAKGMYKVSESGEVSVDTSAHSDFKTVRQTIVDNDPSIVKYTLTVTASPDNTGSVTGGGTFREGSVVTITAQPNAGYVFQKWSDGITTPSRQVTMDGAKSFTAQFTLDD